MVDENTFIFYPKQYTGHLCLEQIKKKSYVAVYRCLCVSLSLDMQKFPLRMKDNDLLVTELYRDPAGDKVTALSVYLTPKTSKEYSFIPVTMMRYLSRLGPTHLTGKPTMWFPNRSDINLPVQSQIMAKGWKFWI